MALQVQADLKDSPFQPLSANQDVALTHQLTSVLEPKKKLRETEKTPDISESHLLRRTAQVKEARKTPAGRKPSLVPVLLFYL